MAAAELPNLQRDGLSSHHDSPLFNSDTENQVVLSEDTGVPLNSSWTFWVDKSTYGASAAQYEATLRKLYTVSAVESFWSVYNNIPQPSQIESKYSYHLMRGDSKPLWEDPAHCSGGNWKLKCLKPDSDEVWRELLLAAIGEKLTECLCEGDKVTGVSISVRERDDVIQIWNTNARVADNATVISTIKQLLPNVQFVTSFYKAFESHEAFEGKR